MSVYATCPLCGAPTPGEDVCDTQDCPRRKAENAEAPDPWLLAAEPGRFDTESARRRSRTRRDVA